MPKKKHTGQTSITLWLPEAEAAAINAHLRAQLGWVCWAEPSRQKWILELIRRELAGGQQPVQPEPIHPVLPVLPVCTPAAPAAPEPPRQAPQPPPARPADLDKLERQVRHRIHAVSRRQFSAARTELRDLKVATEQILARYRDPAATLGTRPVWVDAARKAVREWKSIPGRGAAVQRLEQLLQLLPAAPAP